MANQELVKFIIEAQRRNFSINKIKESLLSNGWTIGEINEGFEEIKDKRHYKESLTLWLDSEVIRLLQKRARKNLLSLEEQIVDILRRSVINQKPSQTKEKLDDMLVGLFSRKSKKKK